MKRLVLTLFIAHLSCALSASDSLEREISLSRDPQVKIVNQRRHKLMLGELNRALENSTNALNRYKRQSELNKNLPVRSRIVPAKADLQKHLARYNMLKSIYDKYQKTEQLLIPLELLTDFVQDEAILTLLLTEAAEEKMLEDRLATIVVDEQIRF